jgi:hypothetical protein
MKKAGRLLRWCEVSKDVKKQEPRNVTASSRTDSTSGLKDRQYTRCPHGCGLVREDRLERHISRVHSANPPLLKKQHKIEVASPKSTDAVWRSISGGRPESNRRKH